MKTEKAYLILSGIFLIMAIATATFSFTGYTILADEQNTNYLGIIFFIAGISSFLLAKLKQKGYN